MGVVTEVWTQCLGIFIDERNSSGLCLGKICKIMCMKSFERRNCSNLQSKYPVKQMLLGNCKFCLFMNITIIRGGKVRLIRLGESLPLW